MIYVGIDPGFSGAWAMVDHHGKFVACGDMHNDGKHINQRMHGPHEPGPTELHHYRGGGWGRGDYKTLMPLCVLHHRGAEGVHGLGVKGFDKFHPFTQRDLLEDALRMTA